MLTDRSSSGNAHRRLRAQETTAVATSGGNNVFSPATMQASLPCGKSVSPGLPVRPSTAIALEGCWSEVPGPGA